MKDREIDELNMRFAKLDIGAHLSNWNNGSCSYHGEYLCCQLTTAGIRGLRCFTQFAR